MPSLVEPLLRRLAEHFDVEPSKFSNPIVDMIAHNWHLGLTCFGGPGVHFQIFRHRFVEKYPWIDDQMYRELFALCQALPGPGSTKMIYAINLVHGGFIAGILSFFIWSLPGALGAYGLAVGVSNINNTLPTPVYALLSGLNAATVGIIALAAVQLSQKAITDKLTRILVFFGGCAGMLYNALWYFPVLMVVGGASTILWDYKVGHNTFRAAKRKIFGSRRQHEEEQLGEQIEIQDVTKTEGAVSGEAITVHRLPRRPSRDAPQESVDSPVPTAEETETETPRVIPTNLELRVFSWKFGATIIGLSFISFIIIMALRGTIKPLPRGLALFANLYLAGTIIFGGGPVVIPLLREYVVTEGWVSARDFLLGLAVCQAFPGPNFNFAVYLGALAVVSGGLNPAAGAVLGYIGIFTPGIVLHTGTMGLWKVLRNRRWFTSCLRGINAAAVGLIYTAVYRLWEQGFLNAEHTSGSSLGLNPWWLVVTATSFVGGRWFGLSAPIAILLGGIMGLIWYGVVYK